MTAGRARRSLYEIASSLLAWLALTGAAARADELNGADQLRVLWSNQMQWTPAGIPIVNVGVADAMTEVVIEGAGARVLPGGDGGAEVRAGSRWSVRLADGVAATPAVITWYVVVGRGRSTETPRLKEEAAAWRARGFAPSLLELGTILGLHGEVIDMRRVLVGVAPSPSVEQARTASRAIADRFHVGTALQAMVVERPRGVIEARDEHGVVVRGEGVLWFAPATDTQTLAIDNVPREGAAANSPGERRDYAGRLYVTVGADGKLVAANAVPEDRLLAALLPSEIGAAAPPEAQRAQAVAARNELYARMGSRHLTDPYRICSRSHCQVYAGAGHEDARAVAAVRATRGELLVRGDGTLLDAVYSADCGGHTEDNDRAWGAEPDPSLRGVLDAEPADAAALANFAAVKDAAAFLAPLPARPSCAADHAFRWSAHVDGRGLAERAGVGRVRDLVIHERGVSGRVIRLEVIGERGKKEVRGELEVRRLLGGLRSALITVTHIERDARGLVTSIDVNGGGHGHGVGLCQAGSIAMAERGHPYREILQRYYRLATVKRFY